MRLIEFVEEVEAIIRNISLPLPLPAEAFFIGDEQRHMPNLETVLDALPATLRICVDLDSTILHSKRKGKSKFLLTLISGGYLAIAFEGNTISELSTSLSPRFS